MFSDRAICRKQCEQLTATTRPNMTQYLMWVSNSVRSYPKRTCWEREHSKLTQITTTEFRHLKYLKIKKLQKGIDAYTYSKFTIEKMISLFNKIKNTFDF